MKSSTKWLVGFGTAIGALVVLAIVLVLALPGSGEIELPPENTPEGVVMRYFQALEQDDFDTAYSYLSESALEENEMDKVDWQDYSYWRDSDEPWNMSITETEIKGSNAIVSIEISTLYSNGGLFSNPVYSHKDQYNLVRIDDEWKITYPLRIPYYIY